MREKIRESENRVADLKAAVDADFSLDLKAASTAGVQRDTDSSATPYRLGCTDHRFRQLQNSPNPGDQTTDVGTGLSAGDEDP